MRNPLMTPDERDWLTGLVWEAVRSGHADCARGLVSTLRARSSETKVDAVLRDLVRKGLLTRTVRSFYETVHVHSGFFGSYVSCKRRRAYYSVPEASV